jgi:hypothetical protein
VQARGARPAAARRSYFLLMLMLPLIVPASTLAAPAPIVHSSRLFFCSEIVTGKSQETRPLTE